MKIDGPGRIDTPSIRRANRKKDGKKEAFRAAAATTGEKDVARVTGGGPLAAIDTLLAVQEASDEQQKSLLSRRRATEMLDILDDIRMGLLVGGIPQSKLKALVQLVKNRREEVMDPRLVNIVDEIELRARVELAKLGQAESG